MIFVWTPSVTSHVESFLSMEAVMIFPILNGDIYIGNNFYEINTFNKTHEILCCARFRMSLHLYYLYTIPSSIEIILVFLLIFIAVPILSKFSNLLNDILQGFVVIHILNSTKFTHFLVYLWKGRSVSNLAAWILMYFTMLLMGQ